MTPNLRCHHDMTGADVASTPKQPSPKQRRRESFADPGGEAFAAIVSADVELDGSALARPVHAVWTVLRTAATVYDSLVFTRDAAGEGRAYLEWTATALGMQIDVVTVLVLDGQACSPGSSSTTGRWPQYWPSPPRWPDAWPPAPAQATSTKCPNSKEFQMTVATTGVPVREPAAHAPAETEASAGLVPVRDGSVPRIRLLWAVAALLEVIADDAPGLPDVAAVAPEHDLGPAEPDHVLFPALIRVALGLPEPHARRSPAKTARLGEPLTKSETRVLHYLPTHMGVPGIAAELCLSANTVKTHLRHVYRKLGAHSRHEAVQRARAIGLLAASSRRPWNAGPPYWI